MGVRTKIEALLTKRRDIENKKPKQAWRTLQLIQRLHAGQGVSYGRNTGFGKATDNNQRVV